MKESEKILIIKYMKSFIFSLDTNLKNFPNRDRVLKSRIENTSYDLLELITLTNMSKLKDDKRYVHEVNISKYSKIFQIINKSRIMVNSSHNVHVSNINDYIVSATSFDGLIEAVEHPDKTFNIGVQWHPERMIDYDENSKKIFDYFIKCCKEEEL